MRVRCLDCRNHFDIKSKSDPKSFFDLAVRMGGFAVVGYFNRKCPGWLFF